jgi:hypothetical protein
MSTLRRRRAQALSNVDCISCHITELEATYDDETTDRSTSVVPFACHYDHALGYRYTLPIALPASFTQQHAASISSGTAHFCIPVEHLAADGSSITLPEHMSSQLQPLQQRKLLSHRDYTVGTKRVLAVRITSTFGESPVETLDDIQQAIFGNATSAATNSSTTTETSVVQQYYAVSHQQLNLIAATGSNIVDGVVHVQLNAQIAGQDIQANLTSQILAATQAALGGSALSDVAEHFIFCLPNSSLLNGQNSWTAFTYLFEPVSVDDSSCTC